MTRFTHFIYIIVGAGLIFGTGYLVYVIGARLLSFLERANPSVAAAVVGAMTTLLVGLGGVLYTQAQIKKREIEEAYRSRKVEIYKGFLDLVARMMASNNKNYSQKSPSEKELVEFLVGFKTSIILWGSPKVIIAQLEFERTSSEGGNVLKAVDNLYKAIREDIGLSNRGLNQHQLVKMYLKNKNEIDEMSESNQALRQSNN